MTRAYYNEFNPFAAQWLRNLIAAGHIAPGDVDERSIEDVTPNDLQGYTQCHFFAGLGAWSLALRRAGWDDARPIWTASCPCQPFSQAGQGDGFDDPRHLWPSVAWLALQCLPERIIGEQVASKIVEPWVDLVQTDLEAMGYAFGAVPFPAAGVGAPHIRDRLYWVADAQLQQRPDRRPRISVINDSGGRFKSAAAVTGFCGDLRLADAGNQRQHRVDPLLQWEESRRIAGDSLETTGSGPVNGFWHGADWLNCRDDRWRPVEPGSFPLVAGVATGVGRVQPGVRRLASSNRTGRLKGYGNALCMPAAQTFIECLL